MLVILFLEIAPVPEISSLRGNFSTYELILFRKTTRGKLVHPWRVPKRGRWQLRHTLSAYDGAYIVLAEKLGAALVTRDGRLASASGHAAAIELF